jgi:hypothetical protein
MRAARCALLFGTARTHWGDAASGWPLGRDGTQREFELDVRGVPFADVQLDESASCEIRAVMGGGGLAADHDAVVACDPLEGCRMREVPASPRACGEHARPEFRGASGAASGTRALRAV